MTNTKLLKDFARVAIFFAVTANVQGATVVLATQPLITSSTTAVAPNVFLMMDDSGSMDWSHMPDDSGDGGSTVPMTYGYYGFRSSQCNGVFYNPAITYSPPVDYTGGSYPNASFTGAWVNGFNTAAGTVNLSTSFKAVDSSSITNQDSTNAAAYYYKYTGSQTKKTYYDSTSTFFKECSSASGASPGNAVFTRITVSTTSGPGGTDERQNFANWYSYYRTRILMMKTSTGLAFKGLGSNYRVGFATMNNNGGSDFLNLATFDSTQKNLWYAKLYGTSAGNSTPLLEALSNVGRMYAHKLSTLNGVTVKDPIQYSCQQNFTVLTTDGFWNNSTNYDLSGNSVGNQDGTEQRPMLDSSNQVSTATTPTTTVVNNRLDETNTLVKTYTSNYYTLGALGADGCTHKTSGAYDQRKLHAKPLTCVQTTVTPSSAPQTTTTVVNSVVVTTNGVVGSPTTSTTTTNSPSTPSYTAGTATVSDAPAGCNPASSSLASWTNGTDAATGSCSSSISIPGTNPSTPTSATTSNTTTTPVATVLSSTGPTVGATTVVSSSSGGTSNTLADVAEYYYKTDLRDVSLGNNMGVLGNDVSQNNVPATGLDGASWQHMTTFTLGLGAPGRMTFSPTYATDKTGDFYAVKTGAAATSSVCTWQTAGSKCNWPTPSASGIPENIDDLWHAAVNGRGTYFSATNPAELTAGLSSALSGVSARLGAAAAATTSNPNVTSGDNFVFESSFISGDWTGELDRRTLSLTTGAPSATMDWSARDNLDVQTSRTLYTYSSSAANHLKLFAWASLSAAEQAYFQTPNISSLSQFCASGTTCLSSADQTAAAGVNLVSFLRGDTTNEATYYHPRVHLLGDIVDAEAAYVRASSFNYADAGYADFKTNQTARIGMVYVAANDGMLHAFVAGGATVTAGDGSGGESWAYLPALELPSLYKLADANYRNQHQYYLDGTPVVGDICPTPPCSGTQWKTILVAGMNAGGRGYYALDVTNPSAPQALWEFTDNNLGYTYGNPEIVKLKDGTWVVLVTSGYNNVLPGDGIGRLYVLNANTGAIIRTISTGVGTTGTPSGLARIRAWLVNGDTDSTALRVYGGDLLGNVWRFDVNGDVGAPGYDAQLLVTLLDAATGGNPQPITTRPTIDDCSGTPMVFVGTGEYLGSPDLANHQQQSVYGIKDSLGTTTYSNPQAGGSGFQQQTLTSTTCPAGTPTSICTLGQVVRTGSSNVVNLATQNGWYMNFLDAGERDNTDPTVAFGTLVMNTNVPNQSACTVGGYSYTSALNTCSGAPVSTSHGVVAVSLGNAIATRPVVITLPNNTVVALTRMSDGSPTVVTTPPISGGSAGTRRVSWRELVNDH